jgi:hypothetical protein
LGQNKNNTVLRVATWLVTMGHFKEINFIFLVVDHTKNVTDRLFISLKHEYRKQNPLFTFQDLVQTLKELTSVTIHPAMLEDFLNYDKLLSGLFWMLAENIQKNHIFSCNDDSSRLNLRHSNLVEHEDFVFYLWKKGTWNGAIWDKIAQYLESQLMPISYAGLNPYKIVEMWKNHRPNVPVEYHSDELYVEPCQEVWLKVKMEKTDRSKFSATLKAKKDAEKEKIESMAFSDGKAKL